MAEQLTGEWFAQRVGKVTASKLWAVQSMAKKDGRPLQAREDYFAELVAERLTGETYEHYVNDAMRWGVEQEQGARIAYEFTQDVDVELAGFVEHPTISASGASPDGLVGDDGLVEIKCPNTSTHIKTLLGGQIDKKYIVQMQWQMACTDRAWCDYVSYDPRLPEQYRMYVQRVERDDEYIKTAEAAVVAFLDEITATIEALRAVA